MTWDQLCAGVDVSEIHPEVADWRAMSGVFRLPTLMDGALSRLPTASIDELFRRLERIKTAAGEVILQQGDVGDYYYIIENGRCLVTRKVGGVDMSLAELKAGDAFGEEALIVEGTRNATVIMKSDGVLLRLNKEDFIELFFPEKTTNVRTIAPPTSCHHTQCPLRSNLSKPLRSVSKLQI